MPNDKPLNNNNIKTIISIIKWVALIIGVVIAAFLGWFGTTTWEMFTDFKAFQATYTSDQSAYKDGLKSMADDRDAMKVEEADLRKRLREAERLLDRLSVRTASLEEYVRR